MTQHSAQPEVLVVGAGPVGLVVACDLLQQGVQVRLVDRKGVLDNGDPHSRAILLWPRSLELLRRIGVSGRLVAAGRAAPGIEYWSEGRQRGTLRLERLPDTPYPFVLSLPQRETERILLERLHELGGRVELGLTLVELTELAGLPQARLRRADGSLETVRPQWLVGADGVGSSVRKLLGTPFPGPPLDSTYVVADAPLSGEVSDRVQYHYSREGVLPLIPLSGGAYRLAAIVPAATAERPLDRLFFQELVDRRTGQRIQVGEPAWTRSFRPRLGLAERFRTGRCLLAGDAAHAMLPAGGQGLNTGLQDAAGLTWRLGGVVAGRLPERVLDDYDRERRHAAREVSALAARQVRLALMQRSPWRKAVRDGVFRLAHRTGLLDRVLAPAMSQLDTHYGLPDAHLGTRRGRRRAVTPGGRLPLFPGDAGSAGPAGETVTGALDPQHATVLLWPGSSAPAGWADRADLVRARLAADPRSAPAPVRDLSLTGDARARRQLRRALGTRPLLAVVRPDGHLALRTEPDRVEEVLHWFGDHALAAPRPVLGNREMPLPATA